MTTDSPVKSPVVVVKVKSGAVPDGGMGVVASWVRGRTVVSAQLAVVLTMVVAVLSVATGIVNISTVSVIPVLAPYVPPSVEQAAGFTGAVTGFLMVGAAMGMRRRLRVAWRTTVVLLPVTLLQGVVQASPYSVPLVGLSLVTIPVVWLTRPRFDRRISLSTSQLAAGAALIGVLAYGTMGTYAMRDEFREVGGLLDAFYFTLVTASTVGYGDVTPQTAEARLFGMSVLVLGTASFAVALGTLLGPAIQARLARTLGRMTESQLDALEDHVVVLGYGDLTEAVVDELEADTAFVVVTPDASVADLLREQDVAVYVGDPSDEATLKRVGIDRARAVVAATDDDADDAMSVLTARHLNAEIRIVAAATDRENIGKLRRAGADTVISPAAIGGRLLVQSALGREGMETLADRVLDEAAEDDAG